MVRISNYSLNKSMKLKTIFITLLLFVCFSTVSCASKRQAKNPESVEEAGKLLAKKNKKASKASKKARKQAYKAHWDLQSKQARKSIKRNKKRHKKNNDGKRIVP